MEVIPAIDIRGGKCVRLLQGDYSREIVFSDDPMDIALKWQSFGAPRIHVVDLDGAKAGEVQNIGIIKDIARALLVPVQMGGGIRDMEAVETALKAGVDRVILGTAAVENREFVRDLCRRFGESVIISLDAREGKLSVRGWQQDMDLKAVPFAREMVKLGVQRFVYTDISRDGMLTEPNFSGVAELVDAVRMPVIASGGVSALNHLKMLKKLGAEGAIIGRALYSGEVNLKQAIDAVNNA